jgi:predicted ATPase
MEMADPSAWMVQVSGWWLQRRRARNTARTLTARRVLVVLAENVDESWEEKEGEEG